MAKFQGFTGPNSSQIQKIYKSARAGLELAVKDIDSSQYRTRFATYMGTAGGLSAIKKGEDSLASSIRIMFQRVATLSFTVIYEPTLAANADMYGHTGAMATTQTMHDQIDSIRSANPNSADADGALTSGGSLVMRFGPNIWTMPFTSSTEQSQVETFLHELSHHAAGTIDDTVGGECYGLTGVTRLKNLGPARAVRNAENVGFFCVDYAK